MNKIIKILVLLILPAITMAQEVEMADTMRSNGKIYVVVAVMAILFIGLLAYLIAIDKKVGKLEKRVEEN